MSSTLPPIQTQMVPSISAISVIDDDEDEYEDIELYRHDLYYVHCHQIIPKSQQNIFQQMLKQNVEYNQNNPLHDKYNDNNNMDHHQLLHEHEHEDIVDDDMIFNTPNNNNNGSSSSRLLPQAPPPTAVHTPLYNTLDDNGNDKGTMIGFNNHSSGSKRTDIATVKTKLERHSKKLEKDKMMNILAEENKNEDMDDDEIERNGGYREIPSPSHFGGQRSIMSLMQSNNNGNINNIQPIVPTNTPHGNRLLVQPPPIGMVQTGGSINGIIAENEEDEATLSDRPSFGFTPSVISRNSNPNLIGYEDEKKEDINNNITPQNEEIFKKNAFNISYYCIPENIDGGILSSSIFLPYKQWCESSIIRFTDQAGECLDQMKKESNMLEHLHRTTITKSPLEDLYDDDDDEVVDDAHNNFDGIGGGGLLLGIDTDLITTTTNNANENNLKQQRDKHLKKLSQIDENLADVRDKIRKMFRVQQHIIFIQQQYDTHINNIRDDSKELLDVLGELQDRYNDCNLILKLIRDNEVWLITNIANTIAERSEKIDSVNRKIKFLEQNTSNNNRDNNNEEKRKYSLIVESTKNFITDLHSLIQELQKISDNKFQEVERLKKSINQIKDQYKVLIKSSLTSYNKVIDRLFELQNHYKLPSIMESTQDIKGQSMAINSSLNVYLNNNNINTSDYFNRCLELYQASIIYSDERTKIFYNTFLLLINNIIIDTMIIDEYVSTNGLPEFSPISSPKSPNNLNATLNLNSKSVGFNDHVNTKHIHIIEESTDQILNDVFTPISLNPSVRSTSFGPLQDQYQNDMIKDKKSNPNKLLNHVLNNNEFNIKFESINLLKMLNTIMIDQEKQKFLNKDLNKNNYDLLKRIKIISYFGHLLPFRETVILIIIQYITIQHKEEIYKFNYDKLKIKEFAQKHALKLLSNILFTSKNKKGIIRKIKNLLKIKNRINNIKISSKNNNNLPPPNNISVYKIAAVILQNVYNMTIPYPL